MQIGFDVGATKIEGINEQKIRKQKYSCNCCLNDEITKSRTERKREAGGTR